MQPLMSFIHFILHIDSYLVSFVSTYGAWTYVVLFTIIFCETGLVITPFLPGDSLLFAAGSIAANPASGLHIQLLFVLLLIASILGNKTNYFIGRTLGARLFAKDRWFLNKEHLRTTHAFYEKHGGKAIIFGRFLPIIRTFVPFVAGIGYMNIRLFATYNIISALLWIGSLLFAGYFLGSIPLIQQNFTIVIYSIIIISLLPPVIAFMRHKIKI